MDRQQAGSSGMGKGSREWLSLGAGHLAGVSSLLVGHFNSSLHTKNPSPRVTQRTRRAVKVKSITSPLQIAMGPGASRPLGTGLHSIRI